MSVAVIYIRNLMRGVAGDLQGSGEPVASEPVASEPVADGR